MRVTQITKSTQKARSIIVMLLASLLATACSNNTIYNNHTAISNDGWESYDAKEFTIDIPTSDNYDINLFIRHSSTYNYCNLWLFVDHITPQSTQYTDTINLEISDPYGKWIGKGWGNSHQIEKNIALKQHLDSGTHIIKVQQAMRQQNLKGIANVGISIKKSDR